MNIVRKEVSTTEARTSEDFNLWSAITVMMILLLFIAVSFYILISSYLAVH